MFRPIDPSLGYVNAAGALLLDAMFVAGVSLLTFRSARRLVRWYRLRSQITYLEAVEHAVEACVRAHPSNEPANPRFSSRPARASSLPRCLPDPSPQPRHLQRFGSRFAR